MGLFLVQILLVVYQFTYTTDAGRPDSNARATRLPPLLVLGHVLLSIVAALLWMGWKAYANDGFAWATFIVAAVAGLLGALIMQRAMFSPAQVDSASGDPADALTVESRIPPISMVLLSVITVALLVFTLLTAVGVFHQP